MPRPLGSCNPTSLRTRVRAALADGAARSPEDIAAALGEPVARIRRELYRAVCSGVVVALPTRYALPAVAPTGYRPT